MSGLSFEDTTYDLLGLGFGPANLSIGVALAEAWSKESSSASPCPIKKVLFIEKHPKFQWHPGMLLPDARMQISFMKDLATLRNPQSPFTFLSYLHSHDRILSFINRGSTVPTRKEFADYLSWAAQRVQAEGVNVLYGHEIIGLFEGPQNTIQIRVKSLATGTEHIFKTRDIVISPGGSAIIPDSMKSFIQHPRFLHSSSYVQSIAPILDELLQEPRPLRIAVVGSGQSAAEVTLNLRERLSTGPSRGARHEIDMLLRKGSMKPSDDSPFANEIFDPASTDVWFSVTSERSRNEMLGEYHSTNYGVVSPRTLEQFYEVIYDQRLDEGVERRTGIKSDAVAPVVNIRPYTSIIEVEKTEKEESCTCGHVSGPSISKHDAFRFVTQHKINKTITESVYDVVICATGYHRAGWINILKNSDVGKRFGLNASSSAVHLLPASKMTRNLSDSSFDVSDSDSASSTSSSIGTPPTSPEDSLVHLKEFSTNDLYISRGYQLIPVTDEEDGMRKSRVYVQGVEELTHGLSDTLLSIVGVRSGEVLTDIIKGY